MRRLMMLTVAPLSVLCGLAVGCSSNSADTPTTWNSGNPWGTHRASQSGEVLAPGTGNSLPPATQPAKSNT